MAQITVDQQGAPSTPAAGKDVLWVDSGTGGLVCTLPSGRHTGSHSRNDATASQGPGFTADTYITNSGILIPSFGMKAGQAYKWFISVNKTAVGVAAPVLQVRIGAAQTTADTSRLTWTGVVASVATATQGLLIAQLSVRNVGAAGVIAGGFGFTHTNFGDGGAGVSISFDNSALAGQFVGLSFNGGAAANVLVTSVIAELIG